MAEYPEQVEITKTVPVNDTETLTAWLNQEIEAWFERNDGSNQYDTVGEKCLSLIKQAGFELKPPSAIRKAELSQEAP